MKHFVGPQNYSTQHFSTQAHAKPIDLGGFSYAVNTIRDIHSNSVDKQEEKAQETGRQYRQYGPGTQADVDYNRWHNKMNRQGNYQGYLWQNEEFRETEKRWPWQ